jgi:hypothetical protein
VAVTVTAIVCVAIVASVYWHVTHGPTEFNRSVWLRAKITSDSLRLRMTDGLLRLAVLLGKSQSEIEAMLRPPTYTGYGDSGLVRKSSLVYQLGPEREYPGIDIEHLALDFDPVGKVRDAHISNARVERPAGNGRSPTLITIMEQPLCNWKNGWSEMNTTKLLLAMHDYLLWHAANELHVIGMLVGEPMGNIKVDPNKAFVQQLRSVLIKPPFESWRA